MEKEYISNCCGAYVDPDIMRCTDCKENCDVEENVVEENVEDKRSAEKAFRTYLNNYERI